MFLFVALISIPGDGLSFKPYLKVENGGHEIVLILFSLCSVMLFFFFFNILAMATKVKMTKSKGKYAVIISIFLRKHS